MTSEYVCEHKSRHLRYESTIKPTNAVSVSFISLRAGGLWHEQVGKSYLFGEILPARRMNIGVRLRETPRLVLRAHQNAQDDAPARLQGSVLSRRLRREPP